jgi:hypothetical protein
MKLLEISHLRDGKHKYVAIFEVSNEIKEIPFGAIKENGEPYEDYTTHKDSKRRTLYLNRHRKKENWKNPLTAGSLSRWLLWGPTTDLKENIKLFVNKFKL